MGMHTLEELLRLYTLEKISVEQATGQILQHLLRIDATLERMEKLEREIERLKAFVGIEPEAKSKKKDTTRRSNDESTDETNDSP